MIWVVCIAEATAILASWSSILCALCALCAPVCPLSHSACEGNAFAYQNGKLSVTAISTIANTITSATI
eukprot:6212495-Pleurochrysis_carterae.AAC.4